MSELCPELTAKRFRKSFCPNWYYCKLGTRKFDPFLLIYFHQLKTYYYRKTYLKRLLLWFSFFFTYELQLSSTLQQLLFQQTYSLLFGWFIIVQTQYRNMDKCCEEVSRSGSLQFTKVTKGSSDLYNKQTSSLYWGNVFKNSENVPYSKSSFCNQLIKYSLLLVSLWPTINTEERTLTTSPYVAVFELTLPYLYRGIQICL